MANKTYWSILTVAGLMADVLANSERTYAYILVYVKHTTCKRALTTVIFFSPAYHKHLQSPLLQGEENCPTIN